MNQLQRTEEVLAALDSLLILHEDRAVIGLLLCADLETAQALRDAVETHLQAAGLPEEDLELRVVSGGAQAAEDERWLRQANRSRNLWLRARRVVLILAADAASLRLARSVSNDLTVAPDLFGQVAAAGPDLAWSTASELLQAHALQQHGHLDLTGLLPADAGLTQVGLDEVYVDVADVAMVLRREAPGPNEPPCRGILLLGAPGSGKTTTLRHLALRFAQEPEWAPRHGVLTPFFLALSEYGAALTERERSLREFIHDAAERLNRGLGNTLLSHLSETVLLLDGLDELRSREHRRRVLDQVGQLLSRREVGLVVLSTRNHLVDELRQRDLELLEPHTCRPLDGPAIETFLTNFMEARFRGRGRDPRAEAATLVERITSDANLRVLARIPLLLVFLALLHDLEGRLPTRRTELYHRMGELLVDRWVRARRLGNTPKPRRVRRGDALRVLAPLAWWVVREGRSEMSNDELLAELTRIEATRETPEIAGQRAQGLLSLLKEDSALLRASRASPGQDPDKVEVWWTFVHPTIAEYFAGIEVARAPERREEVLQNPFAPEWAEVLPFALGYLDLEARDEEGGALARAVLSRSSRQGRYDARYPLLLMSLLQEEPRLPSGLEQALVERVFRLCFENDFGRAARVVMQEGCASFLLDAPSRSYRDTVSEALRRRFVAFDAPVRWDRLVKAGAEPDAIEKEGIDLSLMMMFSARARLAAGPLISRLIPILERHQLDPGHLRGWLQGHADWRLRHGAVVHRVEGSRTTGEATPEWLEQLEQGDPRLGRYLHAQLTTTLFEPW